MNELPSTGAAGGSHDFQGHQRSGTCSDCRSVPDTLQEKGGRFFYTGAGGHRDAVHPAVGCRSRCVKYIAMEAQQAGDARGWRGRRVPGMPRFKVAAFCCGDWRGEIDCCGCMCCLLQEMCWSMHNRHDRPPDLRLSKQKQNSRKPQGCQRSFCWASTGQNFSTKFQCDQWYLPEGSGASGCARHSR